MPPRTFTWYQPWKEPAMCHQLTPPTQPNGRNTSALVGVAAGFSELQHLASSMCQHDLPAAVMAITNCSPDKAEAWSALHGTCPAAGRFTISDTHHRS
jgi:hypothetical protein